MRSEVRIGVLVLTGVLALSSQTMAKPVHHRHYARRIIAPPPPPPPPTATQEYNEFAGVFAGYTLSGFLGASEADPYERTGRAYSVPRYHEPGLEPRY